jgi:hypothetical protein
VDSAARENREGESAVENLGPRPEGAISVEDYQERLKALRDS